MDSKKRLIVITGPTAIGKTSLAIDLAKALNTEIVSADSRQIYKDIDIGTAKASKAELAEVKHHFIDHLELEDEYSAGQYEREVNQVLVALFKKKDDVLLCGGSGLYIDAVLKGIDFSAARNEVIRLELESKLERGGLVELQNELKSLDPEAFERVDIKNPVRLIRVLEIIKSTGKSYADSFEKQEKQLDYKVEGIVLEMERPALYERINNRVDQMMNKGLLGEAKSLYPKRSLQALQTVGYKELFDYFDDKMSLEEAVDKIKQHTRNYAKRQITWFKRYEDFARLQASNKAMILKYLNISSRE